MGGSNVVNQQGTYGTQGTAARRQHSWGANQLLLLGPMRPEISGSSVGMVTTQRGHWDTSTTCGSTARANGRGWAGRTWSTSRGRTGLRGRLPPATFLGRETVLLVGPMRPEISGSSVGMVTTRRGQSGYLNDLWKYSAGQWTWMGGSNVVNQAGDVRDSGDGCPQQRSWGARRVLSLGPMRPEISGSSVGLVTTQRRHSGTSTTYGSTSPKMYERHARCPRAVERNQESGTFDCAFLDNTGHERPH